MNRQEHVFHLIREQNYKGMLGAYTNSNETRLHIFSLVYKRKCSKVVGAVYLKSNEIRTYNKLMVAAHVPETKES